MSRTVARQPAMSWAAGLLSLLALCLTAAPVHAAQPSRLAPLHRLSAADGDNPTAALLRARDGSWYGTTNRQGAFGNGSIFRVAPDGAFEVLHSFDATMDGGHGTSVYSALSEGPDGTLYGSALAGGFKDRGSLFSITPAGVYTLLHTFTGDKVDGKWPVGPPKAAPDGNFYGVTGAGGLFDRGMVYRMAANGDVSSVGSFRPETGGTPRSLLVGQDGALYGSTAAGPSHLISYGTVYRMSLAGVITTLHIWPADGHEGRFIRDLVQVADGSLYGVAQGEVVRPVDDLDGQIFQLGLDGSFRLVHGFVRGGSEGHAPNASLSLGDDGLLYGATAQGGRYSGGTAFGMATDGSLTLLYSFGGRHDPELAHPAGGLGRAEDGSFRGTVPASSIAHNRHGAVFSLTPR